MYGCTGVHLKGREAKWTNPKLPEMPRNLVQSTKANVRKLKHIIRPTCYVEIGFSWVRPLCFSALREEVVCESAVLSSLQSAPVLPSSSTACKAPPRDTSRRTGSYLSHTHTHTHVRDQYGHTRTCTYTCTNTHTHTHTPHAHWYGIQRSRQCERALEGSAYSRLALSAASIRGVRLCVSRQLTSCGERERGREGGRERGSE